MDLVTIELHFGNNVLHLSIHSHFAETALTDILKKFPVMSFTPFYNRSEQIDLFSGIFFQDEIHDLIVAVPHHFFSRVVAVRFSRSCKQQTKKIIDLGDRSHGRAWIFVHCFLFDGDHRT